MKRQRLEAAGRRLCDLISRHVLRRKAPQAADDGMLKPVALESRGFVVPTAAPRPWMNRRVGWADYETEVGAFHRGLGRAGAHPDDRF